jgi:hypothetical protein
MSRAQRVVPWAVAALLTACAGTPAPEWAADAHAAMQRTQAAVLAGEARIEAVEFQLARSQIARSGRTDLLARAELMRCAALAASLAGGDCPGFEARRDDATPADRAYAAYLAGRLPVADVALLPAVHQAAARGEQTGLAATADPLTRLVAASTVLQAGRASDATVALAVDTASAQGWRRAVLAWLGVQHRRAVAAGDEAAAVRLQRRIDAAGGVGTALR